MYRNPKNYWVLKYFFYIHHFDLVNYCPNLCFLFISIILDSLEACKVHMDLGIHLGQQRKLKDIINWIKKKKKRSIRKDELISFLIGKQYPCKLTFTF